MSINGCAGATGDLWNGLQAAAAIALMTPDLRQRELDTKASLEFPHPPISRMHAVWSATVATSPGRRSRGGTPAAARIDDAGGGPVHQHAHLPHWPGEVPRPDLPRCATCPLI